jgi:extracellular elastinolytic metalloproteinase
MPPSHFLGGTEFLTGPQPGNRLTLAEHALSTFAPQLGLDPLDVANPWVTSSYADSTGSGTFHAYFRQSLNGLEVLNTSIGVHVTPDGRVVTVNGGFVHGIGATATGLSAPARSPDAAVAAAAAYFGITLTSAPVLTSTTAATNRASVVTESEASVSPIDARLVYVNTPAGVRLAWAFDMDVPGGRNWYNVAVDDATGQVTFWDDWVDAFSPTYNALPLPETDPTSGPRRTQVNPHDPVASPFGWHDTDGVTGPEFTDTRGNNVWAQADLLDTDASNVRPNAGSALVFDYPQDLTIDPLNSIDAATTQLFYMNNKLHDIHYKYGFNEVSGNFQLNNYGRGGVGGDPVDADVLDGATIGLANNAFFATPGDGSRPRMMMFVFNSTNPSRDGDFANEIVIHEYGHGVSNRLTGGPAAASGLQNYQSRGMGEGWSDWWSLMLTQLPTDQPNDAYPTGTWALGQPPNGGGIRRFPYSFNMSVNPQTFDDYGSNPSLGYPEEHDTGELWTSVLWDMNWLLVNKYGFDKDLTTGYSAGNTPAGAGNKLALQLVMDGLKLQPANPTFLDARDAILTADQLLTGGQNRREIWTAFARRGLGPNATTGDSNDFTVVTDYSVPIAASYPAVIAVTPAARQVGGSAPTSVTFTFSEPMNAGSFSAAADVAVFTGPAGQDLKGSITGFTWVSSTQMQLNFTAPAGNAAQGNYRLVLGPDIRSADDNTPLDQDFDRIPNETTLSAFTGVGQDQFVANFRYDALALQATITAELRTDTAGLGMPAAIIATFNEAIDPASVTAADLQLSNGIVTGVTVMPGNTVVRFDVAQIAYLPLYVSIRYGDVTDPYGFPVEEANQKIEQTFPTDVLVLEPFGPLGWQSYTGVVNGVISSFGQTRQYKIELDAGTVLSVGADNLSGLRAQLRIINPNGTATSPVTSVAGGNPVYTNPLVVTTPGTYTIEITGVSNSTGSFRLRAFVGASIEGESRNPTDLFSVNDSAGFGGPEVLNSLLQLQGGPGLAMRGITVSGNVGGDRDAGSIFLPPTDSDDNFSVPVTAGQPLTVGLRKLSALGTLTVTVTGPGGTQVTTTPTNFDQAVTFTPTASGTAQIRISGGFVAGGIDYALSVLTNGVMDQENNATAAAPQPIPLGSNVRGGITPGDEDWYSVTVPAGLPVTLFLATTTPGDGPGQPTNTLDPHVEVYNAAGTVLLAGSSSTDNAAGDLRNSVFSVTLDPNPTQGYRIRVFASPNNALGATIGSYALTLSTATNPGPVGVSAGGPYTLAEGGSLQLTGIATDPNGDGLTYLWDLNGDGAFGDVTGQSPLVPWSTFEALGVNDGPGVFTVRLRVTDGVNPAVTSAVSLLTVTNAPPTGNLYIGTTGTDTAQTVNEGSAAVTIRIDSPSDPSAVDVGAGLRYAFDLNGDGVFGNDGPAAGGTSYATGVTATSATIPASFFADGLNPAAPKTVQARVYDKDGGFSTLAVTFTVVNVAPDFDGLSGTLGQSTAGPVTVTNPRDASPADAAALLYSFDFDPANNNGYEVVDAASPTVTVPANFVPATPGPFTIRVRVRDKDGGESVKDIDVTVTNAAPSGGTLTNAGPVNEGSSTTVTLSGATDPSPADTAAGFRYLYDFDGDGTFDFPTLPTGVTKYYDIASTSNSATVPAEALDDNVVPGAVVPNTRRVRVVVLDQNDGYTEYFTDVLINNVDPTATLSGPAAVDVGSPLVVSLTGQTDPSTADTLAGFTYAFDLNGDGDFDDAGEANTGPTVTIQTKTPGPLTVRARIMDKDGGFSIITRTFDVENVQPTATLDFPGTVNEGGAATIQVNASHPSAVTTTAGFRYAFDFDGDGTFDFPVGVTDYATASPLSSITVPTNLTADGLRPLSVRVRVFEVNGLSADFVAPIQVLGVAPTATFSGPTGTVHNTDPVTFSFAGATDPSPTDRAAGFRYSFDLNGDGDFTDDGEVADSTSPTLTTAFRASGPMTVRGRVTDKDGEFTDYFFPVAVKAKAKSGFAAGVDAGNVPAVQLYDARGNQTLNVLAFDPSVTGGVRVASADVTGDGVPDLIAGTGPGSVAELRVLDGVTGQLVFSARPFDNFTGGMFVAAGDMDGDGRAEIAVSPDQGGGPRVVLYRGLGFLQVSSFFGIDDSNFRGGARVSLADLTGDGRADLLIAAGFGGGPRVAGYDGQFLVTGGRRKLFNDFFAFDPSLRNGVYLAGGDVNGDGRSDLVVGAGPGGGPAVTVFDGAALLSNRISPLATFFTGNTDSRGGVRVTVADLDGDGLADVVTGEADGPRLNVYYGKDLSAFGRPIDDLELTPFSTPMNGVFVG